MKVKHGDICYFAGNERISADPNHVVLVKEDKSGTLHVFWADDRYNHGFGAVNRLTDRQLQRGFKKATLSEVVLYRFSGLVNAEAYDIYVKAHNGS